MENYSKIEDYFIISSEVLKTLIVQELCESRGGRPGLSVLTSHLASVDVKLGIGLSLSLVIMSTDIRGH